MLTGCKTPGAWIPLPTASHRLRPHAQGVPLLGPTHPSGHPPSPGQTFLPPPTPKGFCRWSLGSLSHPVV